MTQKMETAQIKGFRPRASQLEVLKHPARFKILDCGRRWGKTITATNWLDEGAINEGGENWWIAPIFAQSKAVFRKKIAAAKKGGAAALIFKDVSQSELRIEYRNGGVEFFKSADNPDNMRGEGLKRVVMDEAARQKREVFEEVIRPAVSDTHGKVLFASTPHGKNWFYNMYTRGQDETQSVYKSWKFPTSNNPKIPAEDIEQARQSLPIDVFNQEYMAEFLENSAGVFRNIDACMNSVAMPPVAGQQYCGGLDLARLTDFTVLTILDAQGKQVFMDRYNLLDWAVQKQRIIFDVNRYNAALLLDSTGIGDPIYDDLRRAGLNVDGYKFTAQSKGPLIEFLMMAFDQKRILILDDQVQKNELDIYEYTIGRSGNVSYNAPDGYHDDCVIALALAWWKLGHNVSPSLTRLGV